ncbi:MAG: hypothetical protein R3B70_16345 [Polyangiaceae bacterium]
MGIWDSVRSTVDRVTGSAANVELEADDEVLKPGQTVNVRIAVKNGLSALEVRAVLLEIEAVDAFEEETLGLTRTRTSPKMRSCKCR